MNVNSNQRTVLLGIFTIVIVIYIARLAYIQIIDTSYIASANNNVLRYVTVYPARGFVYDRNGKLLVYNQSVFDLMITPREVKEIDTTDFCNIIGITKEDFIKKIVKAKQYSRYKASVFEKQLSSVTNAMLQEKMYKFNGFFTVPRTIRSYPQLTAAHLLGYIGEVDDKTIEKRPYYKSGDYIGISGIEQSYEEVMRGKKGLRVVMVDVHNNEKGSFQNGLYDSSAVVGQNVSLSLDMDLQKFGEDLMLNKTGGIVAIDPQTGEILASVTSPTYDPNLLVGRERTHNYAKLLFDPYKPLYNRALMAYYPPGSTFKLINDLIGSQEGVLFPNTTYNCPGGYQAGSHFMKCDERHGTLDLRQAIAHSCNTYHGYVFHSIVENHKYKNTEEGYQVWRNYVLSMGIGKRLYSDLPQELKGFVPTVEYYNKYFGKGHWSSSTVISLSIGQGELGITPLQMANTMCIIANKGYYYTPHIVKKIGNTISNRFNKKNYTAIEAKYFDVIQDGMEQVVEAGTAAGSRIKGVTICGKTGTAQNPHGKNHSLFVAFAPRENPKIAIGIMVENAGWGSAWAAPIASLMIEKYLNDSISRPDLEKRMKEGVILPGIYEKKNENEVAPVDSTKKPNVVANKVDLQTTKQKHR